MYFVSHHQDQYTTRSSPQEIARYKRKCLPPTQTQSHVQGQNHVTRDPQEQQVKYKRHKDNRQDNYNYNDKCQDNRYNHRMKSRHHDGRRHDGKRHGTHKRRYCRSASYSCCADNQRNRPTRKVYHEGSGRRRNDTRCSL